MKNSTGIICEFDPFHKGHEYLIDSVRGSDDSHAVVCIMSGNFTQRGWPSLWSKFTRARAAVRCGADLVIELPAVFAVSSAPVFARGGIKVLKELGIADRLAFGSETGDAAALKEAALSTLRESDAFREALSSALSEGHSYSSAYSSAMRAAGCPQVFGDRGPGPNDILALEYIRQNILQDAGLDVIAVRRAGSNHDGSAADGGDGFASGSDIRRMVLEHNEDYVNYLPDKASGLFECVPDPSQIYRNCFSLLSYKLISTPAEELANVLDMSEGLEFRLKEAVLKASDMDSLVKAAKSRRYTYARISRLLMHVLLGLTRADLDQASSKPFAYLRVLAFSERRRALIREVNEREEGPKLLTNPSGAELEDPVMARDIYSSDVYSVLCGRTVYDGSDLTASRDGFR